MHLKNVEMFCDIVARRSFSKAAEAHNVSQSSASQTVNMLEKRLGTQLIDRSKRPFELTAAGEVYFEGCRKLLESFRKTEDRVQRMKNRVAGRVRVAAIYSVGLLQMDCYVKRFIDLYPDVDLQVEYVHPDDVYSRLLADELDLGLVSFPRDGGEIGCIPWQEQEMVLVVDFDHRFAAEGRIPLSHLDGENFVAFTTELTIRRQIDRWLKQARINVEIVHEFDNVENIKRAVEIGSGVALLPLPTVTRELELGSLIAVRFVEQVDWARPLGIVHRRNKTLTTAANKFVELLHENPESFPNARQKQHPRDISRPATESNPGKNAKRPRAASGSAN